MKYTFTPMSMEQYLTFVNREENPSTGFEVKYMLLGNLYFAYALTELGKFVSESFDRTDQSDEEVDAFFDKATEDLTKQYTAKKDNLRGAGFLTFNSNS